MRTTLIVPFIAILALTATIFRSVPVPAKAAFHVKPDVTAMADGATISWETPEPAANRIEYWINPNQASFVVESGPARHHQIRLSGLEPGTTSSYRLRSAGQVSLTYKFQTGPRTVALHREPLPLAPFLPLPGVSVQQFIAFHVEPYLQLPTPNAMTVMWETTAPLPSQVEFGLTEELGSEVHESKQIRLHQMR